MTYPCTACGACCRVVGTVLATPREEWSPAYREALDAFPYQARADGSCEQLGEDGRCQVYESRPDICNIETMAARSGLGRALHFAIAARSCNALQARFGLDESYRVPLPEIP